MTDIFSAYERGLEKLLERLGKDHPRYGEVLVLQSRLLENIAQARRYGDTETRRAERAQIVDALNRLTMETIGESFTQLQTSVESHEAQRSADRVWELREHLQSLKKYLRQVRNFPPKNVVDQVFTMMDRVAQTIEEIKTEAKFENLSLRLYFDELLSGAEKQLQHCRTQCRILRQLNGEWNIKLDNDPVEEILVHLDELVEILDKMTSLLEN